MPLIVAKSSVYSLNEAKNTSHTFAPSPPSAAKASSVTSLGKNDAVEMPISIPAYYSTRRLHKTIACNDFRVLFNISTLVYNNVKIMYAM